MASAEPPAAASPAPAGPRWFARLLAALSVVGTALILGLMVLINSDVLGRALFNQPVRGTAEMVAMSIVAIVFLQAPHALACGRMIRSEVLIEKLERAWPAAGGAANAAFELCGAALFAAVAAGVWPALADAWEIGAYVGAQGDSMAPVWPVHAVVVLGAGLTALQYALMAAARLRAAAGPAPAAALPAAEGPRHG